MAAFADEVDATFDEFGEAVTWTPAGGSPVAGVLAIRYAEEAGGAPGATAGARRNRTRFELRKSDIGAARPANGSELLDAAGQRHAVKSADDKPEIGAWLVTTEQVGS